MIDKGIVHGSEAQAKPLVVNVDTVYVHTNIKEIETEDGSVLYEYNEVQYSLAEFMMLVSERTDENTAGQTANRTSISEIEDALIEISEIIYPDEEEE